MPRPCDPRRAMNIETNVVIAADRALAGVNARPYRDPFADIPIGRIKAALKIGRCGDGAFGGREDRKERIALGGYNDPRSGTDRLSNDPGMCSEDPLIGVADLLQQTG